MHVHSFLALLGLALTISAKPISTATDSQTDTGCVDGSTYTTDRGTWKVQCGVDHAGGDFGYARVDNFAGCKDACSTNPQCIDAQYVDGNCYLKNYLTSASTNPNVDSVMLQSAPPPACEDGKVYTAASGTQYTISCGADYYGGDLSNVQTSTLSACIDACDTTSGCIDVSYRGNTCYLKNTLTPAVTDSNVNAAKKVVASSTTTSSTTSSIATSASTTTTEALTTTPSAASSSSTAPTSTTLASSTQSTTYSPSPTPTTTSTTTTVSTTTTTTSTSTTSQCPAPSCTNGFAPACNVATKLCAQKCTTYTSFVIQSLSGITSEPLCNSKCVANAACKSTAYLSGTCYLLNVGVAGNQVSCGSTSVVFSDVGCYQTC